VNSGCTTQIFGRLLCVTCCSCITAGGVQQCQCSSDCASF
jgi:hypothetical protein